MLATRNEEANIASCLKPVKDFADEIIVVDEESIDKTRQIAKKFGAKVYKVKHEPIFHKTKQKALDKAGGDWILQLDADERVTEPLANEIKKIINLPNNELQKRLLVRPERPRGVEGPRGIRESWTKKIRLFKRYQKLIEQNPLHSLFLIFSFSSH